MNESNSKVLARMTITKHGSSKRTIIEVHADASFNRFYTWYSQEGRKNKRFIMTSHRGDGMHPLHQAFGTPGLETLAESLPTRMHDLANVKIKIFSKREYNRVLNCAPDQLGGGLPKADNTQAMIDQFRARSRKGVPVRFPLSVSLRAQLEAMNGGGR